MNRQNLPIAFLLTLCVCLTAYNIKTPCKCESILPEIKVELRALQERMDNMSKSMAKIAEGYTDNIAEQAAERERLIMENAAYKDYIKGFSWIKESEVQNAN